jgi:hypothetical protein
LAKVGVFGALSEEETPDPSRVAILTIFLERRWLACR